MHFDEIVQIGSFDLNSIQHLILIKFITRRHTYGKHILTL